MVHPSDFIEPPHSSTPPHVWAHQLKSLALQMMGVGLPPSPIRASLQPYREHPSIFGVKWSGQPDEVLAKAHVLSDVAYKASASVSAVLASSYLLDGDFSPLVSTPRVVYDVSTFDPDMLDIIVTDPRVVCAFAKRTGWRGGDAHVIAHHGIAIRYCASVLGTRWPELEQLILMPPININHVISYANKIILGPWVEAERTLLQQLHTPSTLTKQTVDYVVEYTSKVLHCRWIDIERTIQPYKSALRAYTDRHESTWDTHEHVTPV